MRERVVPILNFREGIKAVPGFIGGRNKDILNFDIDNDGFCVPRSGQTPIVSNIPLGVYPRSTSRILKTDRASVGITGIHYDSDTLTIGMESLPSALAGLDSEGSLVLITPQKMVTLDILAETYTDVVRSPGRIQFPIRVAAEDLDVFADNTALHIVILFDATEAVYYAQGDQFYVAHYLGDENSDPVSRYYLLPKNTHVASIQKGRILLLADGENQYFIDVKENRRYRWELTPPYFLQMSSTSEVAGFEALRNKLLLAYRGSPNLDIFGNFPYKELAGRGLQIYGWKFTYENPELGISTKPAKAIFIDYEHPQDAILTWLYEGPVRVGQGTTYEHRYQGLLHEGLITADEFDIIESQHAYHREAVFDFTNRPDWATHIGIYRAEIPLSAYTANVETELEDIATPLEAVTTFLGTGLVATGAIIASSAFIHVGVPFVIIGLIGLAHTEGTDRILYEVDMEFVENLDDTHFQRQELHRISSNPVHYTVNVYDNTDPLDIVYLDAFYNDTPHERLDAILLHAGRIYGVDRETEKIVFSHIDGNGISNYFVFPKQNAFSTEASGTAPIEKLEQMPDRGGIYVFKRDAIHYLDGHNIFSGLYDINVSAQTDINIADYKKNVGCISARSVVNDGEVVLFVGSDAQVYTLSGKQATPIGISIEPFIEALTIEELQDTVAAWHHQRFHVALPDSVLVLHRVRKYWTRFSWQVKDMFWSRGGQYAESIFYGLTTENTLVNLNAKDAYKDFGIAWEANVERLQTRGKLTGVYVYTEDTHPVTVTVTGDEPAQEVVRTFTPKLSNKYRAGCNVNGRNIRVKVESAHPVTIDRIAFEEVT